MKKLVLSAAFLIAGAFGVLAQGQVDFDNAPWLTWPDSIDRLVYVDRVGGTPVSDASWTASLLENRGGTWTQLGDAVPFFGAGLEGIWAGDGVKRIISVPVGPTQLEVVIKNAQGAVLGTSAPFAYTVGATQPPAPVDTMIVNFRAFAVPEPSTIAMGVVGLGALLLFRRRK